LSVAAILLIISSVDGAAVQARFGVLVADGLGVILF
jgi:hypothetical protein